MKKIPYSIIDYKKLQTENYEYIDKTMYLNKLEDVGTILICLRPGRFGKSLFTSMMYYYYDINSESLFESLFKTTYVYQSPTSNKNNYYVLKFDFSGITTNEKCLDDLEESFKGCIYSGIYDFIKTYQIDYQIPKEHNSADMMKYFLTYLKGLNLDHKVYIIIDEYDNFTNAILEGDGKSFLSAVGNSGFVKSFYANIKIYVKESLIDRVFITGICPITMDSMTTGFNVATNISLNPEFASMIGLTHEEVLNLLNDIKDEKRNELYELMIKNYDGYLFSRDIDTKVFNATLVMYFLDNYMRYGKVPRELIDSNIIVNYGKIENLVKLQNNEFYESVLNKALKSREISGVLKTSFDLNLPFTEDDIVSLLYYFGYLTIKDENVFTNSINFKIPNQMMKEVYNNFFIEILREKEVVLESSKIEKAMKELSLDGTIYSLTEYVSELLKESDNRVFIKFDEKYIELMYFTILRQNSLINTYTEYPCKNGYIDIFIEKKSEPAKYNIMIELKYIKKKEYKEELLEEKRREGIEQLMCYSEEERIEKENLKRYLVIFVGNETKLIESV